MANDERDGWGDRLNQSLTLLDEDANVSCAAPAALLFGRYPFPVVIGPEGFRAPKDGCYPGDLWVGGINMVGRVTKRLVFGETLNWARSIEPIDRDAWPPEYLAITGEPR